MLRSVFRSVFYLLAMITVAAACSSGSDSTSVVTDAVESAPAAEPEDASASPAASSESSASTAFGELPEFLRIDEVPLPEVADVPLPPGELIFHNSSTTYRDADARGPVVQQFNSLDTAADVTRFYLDALPAAGYALKTGFNNAIVDVSEVEDDALQFQLIFTTPDDLAGQLIITPNPAFGASNIYLEILTKASSY